MTPIAAVAEWQAVVDLLERAGKTLLSMRIRDPRPTEQTTAFPEILRERSEGDYPDGSAEPFNSASAPSAREISSMDEALSWIARFIPKDKATIRRIVHARCLVNPVTDKHKVSWEKVAKLTGSNTRSVKLWHQQGINLILAGLTRAKCL